MLRYTPTVCLRCSCSCSMYSHSRQLQRTYTQRMTSSRYPQSHLVGYHANPGFIDFSLSKNKGSSAPQSMTYFISLAGRSLRCGLSTGDHSLSIKLGIPSREKLSSISWNFRGMPHLGGATTGLCLCFSVSGVASAEGPADDNKEKTGSTVPSTSSAHGKKVYKDYSVTGIPGDGRCLFRSVAHGACIRSNRPIPNEDLQRKLADELRAMVADEFVKRRAETEWFVEGDFDTYVSQIRNPHVWGGEPELFMASHVLQMPITVYMHDDEAGGLIAIAEYGQEYGKEDPIQVLYHGFGHYDALQIPGREGPASRL